MSHYKLLLLLLLLEMIGDAYAGIISAAGLCLL
jgi:hypothetical protein